MGLNFGTGDARTEPPTMPTAGGTVSFVFEVRATNATTFEQTTYTIRPAFPYEFTNGTREIVGATKEVTIVPHDHGQPLTLRKVGPPDVLRVTIHAQVREVDQNGNPLVGSQPFPLDASVTPDGADT